MAAVAAMFAHEETIRVGRDALLGLSEQILIGEKLSPAKARLMSESLVEASLRDRPRDPDEAWRIKGLRGLTRHQLAFVRENVPSSAVVIIDDDLWVDLHEGGGGVAAYPNAHSHWKAVGDPEVRDRLLQRDWRRIDYLVLSDDLAREWERQAGFGVPNVDMLVEAYRHSEPMARFVKGAVELQVRRVNK